MRREYQHILSPQNSLARSKFFTDSLSHLAAAGRRPARAGSPAREPTAHHFLYHHHGAGAVHDSRVRGPGIDSDGHVHPNAPGPPFI